MPLQNYALLHAFRIAIRETRVPCGDQGGIECVEQIGSWLQEPQGKENV